MRTARSNSRLVGGGSASVHAGIHPPVLGLDPSGQTPNLPPPGCGPEDPPPWTEFVTHASENIILPQLRCGR